MSKPLRTGARVLVVSALTVGALPFGSAVSADQIRTETSLGGFSVNVQASPVLVLLDDPKAAVPRPTGTAVIEGDPNFTLAEVATGPNARAVASTVWPGNLFGEGLPAIDNRIPPYPLKAESRYPDKPYTAKGVDQGQLTSSSALGLDAFAQADGAPTNKPGQITVGSATSTSTATVTDKNVAVGTAVSAVHDVNLIGGVIHIGEVTTHLSASSDGKTPTSRGTTTMTGLTIAGQAFTVDDKGLHAGPQNSPLPPLITPQQVNDAGITISGLGQTSSKSSNGATRTASGLVVRIDTATLKKALKPGVDAVKPYFAQVIGAIIPPAQQGYFFYLLNATPSITFVFGAGTSGAAATLPLSFSFPPPPVFPSDSGLGSVALPPTTGGSQTVATPGLDTSPPSATVPAVTVPVLQAPGSTSTHALTDAGFAGIGSPWLLGALVGSGLAAWGLVRFLGLAGGLLGFGCRLGAPTSIPNLRSVTA